MLGRRISSTLAGPTTSPAARTQTAVTCGVVVRPPSVPRRKLTSIVHRLAAARPRATCVIRSSTCAAAPIAQGPDRAQQLDLLGDDVGARSRPGCSRTSRRWDRASRPIAARTDRGCVTNCAATAIGSTARCGRAACPPTPRIAIRNSWQEAVSTPGALADPADAQVGIDVQGHDRADVLHRPRLDHLERSLADLLGRLEDRPPGDRARASDSRASQSARAAARAIVACASWPQACITPSRHERYGTFLASAIRRASISARKATRGRSPSPSGSAISPRPEGAIRTRSPASPSWLRQVFAWSGIPRGSARDGRAGAGARRPSVRPSGRSPNQSPPATRS